MIRIEIHGEDASEALAELKIIAQALTGVAAVAIASQGDKLFEKLEAQASINRQRSEAVEQMKPVTNVEEATAQSDDGEIDVDGHAWSEDLHASTRSKTKSGHWRMKVGVSRPDPLPGFPIETPSETSTPSPASPVADTATAQAGSTQTVEPASAAASQDDDDEFAAFRAAAAKADAEDEKAKANVPARKWTDADLGALCNQAAVKLGDPAPIKEAIAQFVPEGEVAHSRNVPADKRAEFVAAVEKVAGIEFAG